MKKSNTFLNLFTTSHMYYSLQVIFGVDGHLIRHRDDAVEEVTESQVYDEDSVGSCHLEVVKVAFLVNLI